MTEFDDIRKLTGTGGHGLVRNGKAYRTWCQGTRENCEVCAGRRAVDALEERVKRLLRRDEMMVARLLKKGP